MPEDQTKESKRPDRKIHPKLRMVSNGDTAVNAIRAEHAGAVCVRTPSVVKDFVLMRGEGARPMLG